MTGKYEKIIDTRNTLKAAQQLNNIANELARFNDNFERLYRYNSMRKKK